MSLSSVVCPLRSLQAPAIVPEPRSHMILSKLNNSKKKKVMRIRRGLLGRRERVKMVERESREGL